MEKILTFLFEKFKYWLDYLGINLKYVNYFERYTTIIGAYKKLVLE